MIFPNIKLLLLILIFLPKAFAEEFKPYTKRIYGMLSFTPKEENYEFFLGADNKLLLISNSCDEILSLRDSLSAWKVNIGEEKGLHKKCGCGKKEVPQDTFDYFQKMVLREMGVVDEKEKLEPLRLKKKIQTRKASNEVGDFCYLDIDGVMPKKAEELAKHQITLDRLNMFNNIGYNIDGINCYNIALNGVGTMDAQRHIDPFEMSKILRAPICNPLPPKDVRPGDLLVYYVSKKSNQSRVDNFLNAGKNFDEVKKVIESGNPIHASVYVNEKYVFEKKGGDVGFPVQFANEIESRRLSSKVHREDIVSIVYRCKNEREIMDMAKKYPNISELFNEVIQYEKCFENFYTYEDADLRKKAYEWIDENGYFFILNKLVSKELEKYKIYQGKTSIGYQPGHEEEVILLEMLDRKIHNMIQDKFGRRHDGPQDFYEAGKGYIWEFD